MVGPAHHRRGTYQRIRYVSGWAAISGLKGGFARAQIGPALIGMAGRVRLLKPDRIAPADRTATYYGRVDADVDPVVLGRCAQDARILG